MIGWFFLFFLEPLNLKLWFLCFKKPNKSWMIRMCVRVWSVQVKEQKGELKPEPLLEANQSRFVLFPIRYPQVRQHAHAPPRWISSILPRYPTHIQTVSVWKQRKMEGQHCDQRKRVNYLSCVIWMEVTETWGAFEFWGVWIWNHMKLKSSWSQQQKEGNRKVPIWYGIQSSLW